MQRGMTRSATAEYLGVSAATVDRWTEKGVIPAPVSVAGRRLWDRLKLDAVFDDDAPLAPSEAWDEALQ